ncbi:MAG: type II toxin-antitoxin system HicB family antitoxin [Limisphaerales bacterium]
MAQTRKERKAKSARYTKLVEWSEEDPCFVGGAPPIIGLCCHGDDEAKVYAALCRIVEEWIELLETDGTALPEAASDCRNYSGKFVLRVEPSLHRRLALKAVAAGESLNSYCAKTLAMA